MKAASFFLLVLIAFSVLVSVDARNDRYSYLAEYDGTTWADADAIPAASSRKKNKAKKTLKNAKKKLKKVQKKLQKKKLQKDKPHSGSVMPIVTTSSKDGKITTNVVCNCRK